MILISRRRWKTAVVIPDNSSSLLTVLHAASAKECAASSDRQKNDDECDDEGNEGNHAGDSIKDVKERIHFAIPSPAPVPGRGVGVASSLLLAVKAGEVLIADANIHHLRRNTVDTIQGAGSAASLKSGILTNTDIQAHIYPRVIGGGEHAELERIKPVLPEFISGDYEGK